MVVERDPGPVGFGDVYATETSHAGGEIGCCAAFGDLDREPAPMGIKEDEVVDLNDDGLAAVRVPPGGAQIDPRPFSNGLSHGPGRTVASASMTAFARELATKAIRLAGLCAIRRTHDLMRLFEDLPNGSRVGIEAACPGQTAGAGTGARRAFGKWRYFGKSIEELGTGTMPDAERAFSLARQRGSLSMKPTSPACRAGPRWTAGRT